MLKDKQKHYGEYDLLRVIAAIAVVAIHVCAALVLTAPHGSKAWWVGNAVLSAARWSVPVFVMLSGALLLRPAADLKLRLNFQKKLGKIMPAMIIWIGIYFLIYVAYESKAPFLADTKTFIQQLMAGSPYPGHLYFLFIILGLYAISPVINLILTAVKRQQLLRIIVALLAVTSVAHFLEVWYLRGGVPVNALTQWMPYVGYFLLGYYLHTYGGRWADKRYLKLSAGVFFGSVVAIAAGTYLSSAGGSFDSKGLYFYEFLSPIVAVSSVAAWLCLKHLHDAYLRKYSFSGLARLTFGVYLCHIAIMMVVIPLVGRALTASEFVITGVVMLLTVVISFAATYGFFSLKASAARIAKRYIGQWRLKTTKEQELAASLDS